MAQFFIKRPVFAWVIAIIIMLAGALSISQLPVSQYPEIAPPSVSIRAHYPGASAIVVEQSVTQVIEQNMTGLDGLLYMTSTSQGDGSVSIELTFENGVDPDIAQVQVQNKLQLATPLLPQVVQEQGIRVSKSSAGFLMVLGFVSTDGRMDVSDIADYVTSNLVDPLSRVEGVGNVRAFGAKYAMRVWLNADALDTYRITASEVVAAIEGQNAQVALGELGGAPAVDGQAINVAITSQGRMETVEQFENIVLRSRPDGSTLLLADVARVERGAESYSNVSRFNRQPASGAAISLATGANAMATAERVMTLIDEYRAQFPEGLDVVVPYDTTPFVKVSIEGVVHTLIEAIALVFLVMLLFLQNFRATLIPTIAVPVVLLGTFGLLAALGYSINMLTMFAMVLAIGLLVDDAIVVVENVERIMTEEGLSPLEATRQSMKQISSALVGIGLVLSAVFVPMAFMGGSTGVIYRQFSATIVSAMALSVLVALILTPALCASMLKPVRQGEAHGQTGFFGWFNRKFNAGSQRYQRGVKGILQRPKRFMLLFVIMGGTMGWLYANLPTAFLPNEDQGILLAQVQGPVGSTQAQTVETLTKIEDYFLDSEAEAVASVFAVQGFSFGGVGQNAGIAFIKLKDWSYRESPSQGAQAVAGRAMGVLSQIKEAMVYAFAPPAIPSLGISSGFTLYLKDNGGVGREALAQAQNELLGRANESELLTKVRPNGMPDAPQLRIDIDPQKAMALGLSIEAINNTLSIAWGGRYIDDFIDRGRVKRVYIQADAPYRMTPEDFGVWSVRNEAGEMVPFSAFGQASWDYGSPRLVRYNGASAIEIQGEAAPGVSSGDAMQAMETLVSQLPAGIGMEWTGISYEERKAGNQVFFLYGLSLLVVFLCLAALYESWSVPTAVLLVAPLGILGTVLAAFARGMEQDIYFQVALLTTVGLTSKNAILIVEFAKRRYDAGGDLVTATLGAVRDRIRPIIMTSLAFGLGVLPLALATGAGSGSQNAIGTGVLGGMLAGTVLGAFFIPLFYVLVQRLSGLTTPKRQIAPTAKEKADT